MVSVVKVKKKNKTKQKTRELDMVCVCTSSVAIPPPDYLATPGADGRISPVSLLYLSCILWTTIPRST